MKGKSFSLKGWSFKEWLKGNWKTIKELVKVGAPLVLALMADLPAEVVPVVVVFGKLALDTLHYWVKG